MQRSFLEYKSTLLIKSPKPLLHGFSFYTYLIKKYFDHSCNSSNSFIKSSFSDIFLMLEFLRGSKAAFSWRLFLCAPCKEDRTITFRTAALHCTQPTSQQKQWKMKPKKETLSYSWLPEGTTVSSQGSYEQQMSQVCPLKIPCGKVFKNMI